MNDEIITVNDVFDKMQHQFYSDYKIAPLLGMSRAGISRMRERNNMAPAIAVKIASMMETSPEKMLILSNIMSNPELTDYWLGMAKKLGFNMYDVYADRVNPSVLTPEEREEYLKKNS